MRLDIVLRTCSNSLLTSKQERVSGPNRELMMKKCFVSLVQAAKIPGVDIFLTILDDHSNERFIDFLRTEAQSIPHKIVDLDKRGYNNSAYEQFKVASECEGLVYIVEDDYLHEEQAIERMLGAYLHLMGEYNTSIVIYPFDCPLRYGKHVEETILHYDGIRYWRGVTKTANTMFTHYSVLQEHFKVFKKLAKEYPKVMEDDTINKLYYGKDNQNAPIRAFSPIPSVAYHLGYSTPTAIRTSHGSWEHLWNRIESWQLIQGWFYHPEFYQQVVATMPKVATAVEIGAWRGRSTCCLASLIKQSGKFIKLYSVDTWNGSDEQTHRDIIEDMPLDLFEDFKENVKMCDVEDVIIPMKMTSVEASEEFEDGSVDFIMIDGAHDYESVKQDIEAWMPKLAKNGMIAGDDYSPSWKGVVKAVDEKFGKKVNVAGTTWYVVP